MPRPAWVIKTGAIRVKKLSRLIAIRMRRDGAQRNDELSRRHGFIAEAASNVSHDIVGPSRN